jgi:hypothetical protein
MKKHVLLFAFVFPVVVLVCLTLYRKKHAVVAGGHLSLPGNALRRSYNIWTNRAFITVKENDEAFRAVEMLASSLPVSEKARSNAVKSCVGLIKAYGRGDWEAFLSVRAPESDFEINSKAVKALESAAKYYSVTNVSKVTPANAIDTYHLLWGNLIKTNGLFSDISFISNSITVVETSPIYLQDAAAPSFTNKTNQNFIEITPTSVLDYRAKPLVEQAQKIEALRFFFFGKTGAECNYYLFIFALNEQSGAWIPWRLTVGYAGAFKHKVAVF